MNGKAPLFLTARVRCGGETHTVGVTTRGRLVMAHHDMADMEVMAEFMGGEEVSHHADKDGVRSIRCFYVVAQWRQFLETGRYYGTPQALRGYLDITKKLRMERVAEASERRKAETWRHGPLNLRYRFGYAKPCDIAQNAPITDPMGREYVRSHYSRVQYIGHGLCRVKLRGHTPYVFAALRRDRSAPRSSVFSDQPATGWRLLLSSAGPRKALSASRGTRGSFSPMEPRAPDLSIFRHTSPLWDSPFTGESR